jgi:HK97 family phage prohead protease
MNTHAPVLLLKDFDFEAGQFSGYASVFNVVDAQGDVVLPGAFEASLRKGLPKLFLHHRPDQVPGRLLRASEDSAGLLVEGQLNLETQLGRETRASLRAGDLDGLSIGARVDDFDTKGDVRLLKKMTLHEISIVATPANAGARVTTTKSARPATVREFEAVVKSLGFSHRESKTLAATFSSLPGVEPEPDPSPELARIAAALDAFRRAL